MKINWVRAREDYVIDENITLENIANKYDTNVGYVKQVAAKEKWTTLRREANKYLAKLLPKKAGETQAEYLSRAFQDGKIMSDLGIKILSVKKTSIGPMVAKEMAVEGHKIQRSAMGLDNPQTQINIQNNNFISVADFIALMHKRKEEKNSS